MSTTKIDGLRQDSPAAMRMLAYLERVGPASRKALEIACYVDQSHARKEIFRMRSAGGLVHIASWELGAHGPYVAVYGIGPGRDAKRPKALTPAQKTRRLRADLAERFGHTTMERIRRSAANGGISALVVDGRTVYRRGGRE